MREFLQASFPLCRCKVTKHGIPEQHLLTMFATSVLWKTVFPDLHTFHFVHLSLSNSLSPLLAPGCWTQGPRTSLLEQRTTPVVVPIDPVSRTSSAPRSAPQCRAESLGGADADQTANRANEASNSLSGGSSSKRKIMTRRKIRKVSATNSILETGHPVHTFS